MRAILNHNRCLFAASVLCVTMSLSASRTFAAEPLSVRQTLDAAARRIDPQLRRTLAAKPSPWIVKVHDVGKPTDVHEDIPWHLLDKEQDLRFNLPNRGQLGVFNPNADIALRFGIGVDGNKADFNPPRRYVDHLAGLAALRVDLGGDLHADVLFLPVASDTILAVLDFANTGVRERAIALESAASKMPGENAPAVAEPAAAWSAPQGRYGYGITVTSGRLLDSGTLGNGVFNRYEEFERYREPGGGTRVGSLLATLAVRPGAADWRVTEVSTNEAKGMVGRIRLAADSTARITLAVNLHRYGPREIEARNQIRLYPAQTDEQALQESRSAVLKALEADWSQLARESFRWYERVPRVVLPDPAWSAAFVCALELPRGNTFSPQGVLEQPWYTFCRVHGHEPYGWWSYGMHAHEHLATFVTNLVEPGLSQSYLRGHFQVQRDDGYIQYGVNHRGKNIHPPLATAPLLATTSWTAYTWSHDKRFLAASYDATARFVRWWRSPARTRAHRGRNGSSDADHVAAEGEPGGLPAGDHMHSELANAAGRLSHWLDFVESVRDDEDLPTWTAAGGAQHQEALDLNCWLLGEERALAKMARELGRGDDADRWQADADARAAVMREHLWHGGDGVYYGRDLLTGRWARALDISTFFPLWCHLATPEQATSIAELLHDPAAFGTDYPVATLAVCHMPEKMRGVFHWRGANWVEMTWLVIQGLRGYGFYDEAARVAEANCRMVFDALERTGHFREFYNSLTGEPSDLTDYIWTAMPAIMVVETFFGLRPTAVGLEVAPALPAGWNDIRIDNLHVRDAVISLRVRRDDSVINTLLLVDGKRVTLPQARPACIPWGDLAGQCRMEWIEPATTNADGG